MASLFFTLKSQVKALVYITSLRGFWRRKKRRGGGGGNKKKKKKNVLE